MSNERFDKLIKKQLESVKPPYKEEAWKNFQRLIPVPWYVALLRKYGGWGYGGLATIAVLTSTYLYTQERTENEQLHEEITTLKSKISTQDSIYNKQASRQTLNAPGEETDAVSKEQQATVKKDTVYITKEVYPDRPVVAGNRSNIAVNKPALQELPEILNNTGRTVTVTNPTTLVKPGANTANELSTNTNNNTTNNGNPAAAKLGQNNATNIPTPGTIAGKNEPKSNNQILTGKEDLINNTLDSLSNLAVAGVTSQKDSSLVNALTDTASTSVKQPAGKSANKNNFKLGPFNARFGLSFDFLGLKHVSVGPVAEVFLLPNLGFNAGLLVSSPEEERHENPREFNRRRGKRFEDVYRNKIPPTEKIERIKFNTTVLKLPLSFNYYLQVKNNWSFIASGGTQLDLSVFRSVDFESTFQGRQEMIILEDRPKPATFNNLQFGVGAQYQLGRFVGQFIPYYNYRFRTPGYGQPVPKIGVNATLKFNLWK